MKNLIKNQYEIIMEKINNDIYKDDEKIRKFIDFKQKIENNIIDGSKHEIVLKAYLNDSTNECEKLLDKVFEQLITDTDKLDFNKVLIRFKLKCEELDFVDPNYFKLEIKRYLYENLNIEDKSSNNDKIDIESIYIKNISLVLSDDTIAHIDNIKIDNAKNNHLSKIIKSFIK